MDQDELTRRFLKSRRRQWAGQILMIPVLLYMYETYQARSDLAGFGIGILIVLFFLIFSIINWRCPACRTYYYRYWGISKNCPHCKTKLH